MPSPSDVLEHYFRCGEALNHLKTTILDPSHTIEQGSRFFTMTPQEIREAFEQLSTELDIQINLLLIASCEASLRIDFKARIKRRGKDSASRQFRKAVKEKASDAKERIRLEDILRIWADESSVIAAGAIGRLLLYRNWVAHGRHWVERRSGLNDPDPRDVYEIIRRFLNSLPGFDPLPSLSA